MGLTERLSNGIYRRNRAGAADQIINDLRHKILSGHLERGARLPSEKELAVHYEVSPPTIREAVRALSSVGLVDARHGAGTFVIAEPGAIMAAALNAVVELDQEGGEGGHESVVGGRDKAHQERPKRGWELHVAPRRPEPIGGRLQGFNLTVTGLRNGMAFNEVEKLCLSIATERI